MFDSLRPYCSSLDGLPLHHLSIPKKCQKKGKDNATVLYIILVQYLLLREA